MRPADRRRRTRPANRVTGRIPATELDRNASSASTRSRTVRQSSSGRSPTDAAQRRIQSRVVPARIAHASDGVARAPSRTRKRLAEVASDR